MFNAGLTGYNVARGLLGALKPRAPRPALVEELLAQGDVVACARRIRALPFLEDIDFGEGAADLERGLRYACAVFARKVTNIISGRAGRFLGAYCLHYEVHNMKVLFRASLERRGPSMLGQVYPLSKRYAAGNLAELRSPEQVVAFYEDSPLAGAMSDAFEVYRAYDGDLSIFEIALDRRYVSLVWAAAERISGREGRWLLRDVLLPWLGTTAVLWVMWMERYRQMSLEEIVTLLALPEEILRGDLIALLVEKKDPSLIAGSFASKRLRDFLAGQAPPADLAALHRSTRRFVWRAINPPGLRVTFDISTLLTALMRWEFIVEDAIAIAGAKRLGLARDDITSFLATVAA